MTSLLKKKQFWGGLIGIALLAYCVKDIRLSELRTLTHVLNPLYVTLSVLTSLGFVALRGMRWRLMISQQTKVTAVKAVTLYAAGQALNIVMPALTGQVGRLILFAKKVALRKTFVFSTIVLEILFDAISLIAFVLMASIAFPFPQQYRFIGYSIAAATALAVGVLYAILHFQKSIEEIGRRSLRERWPGAYISVKKFIRSFIKGIDLLRSSQHLAGLLLFSMASWTVHMLAIYCLFLAFGFKISFVGAAVLMIINTVILMIPITPGNAGTFEVAVSTSLAAFGVGRSDAVLFALALHIVDVLPMFLFGVSYLQVERISVRQLSHQHEDDIIFHHISEEGSFVEEETV